MTCAATLLLFAALMTGAAADATPKSVSAEARAHGAITSFKSWTEKFTAAAAPSTRAQMLSQGLSLARQRRSELSELIQTDPRAALAAAIPMSTREQLPADIAAELESRVSGVGDLTVLAYLPAKGGLAVRPIERTVHMAGRTYQAYVYGRRANETSKVGIPLYGIAVGDMLAVAESAIRELEPGEAPPPGQGVVDLQEANRVPAPGTKPTLAEVGGKFYRFSSADTLRQAETRLQAAEAGLSPTPTESLDTAISGAPAPRAPLSPWTTGLKKVLIIRVDFSDLSGDPVGWNDTSPPSNNTTDYTADYVQGVADSRIAPYYATSSYGLTTLSNTVTTKVYRMPQTAAAYATGGLNDQLHTDAETAAGADYDLASYDRVVVLFSFLGNLPGSLINYGGLAEVVGKRVWLNGEFDFRVVAHELGHTYGLYHAGLWLVSDGNPISTTGTTIEYGDDFDTMGANYANDWNTDFSARNKNVLGWVSDTKVVPITTNGVYRVYASDWANSAAAANDPVLALTLVKDDGRTYWISVRRNFTSNDTMSHGAYVVWALNSVGGGSGGGFSSQLLDLNTPGLSPFAGVNSDYDAALEFGETFDDPALSFQIQPVREGGAWPNEYLDLQVGPAAGAVQLQLVTNSVIGGNGNGVLDPDECNSFSVVLTNTGTLGVTNIHASLSTITPGVAVSQGSSAYVDLPPNGGGPNSTPFQISTSPSFLCGSPIDLTLLVRSDQGIFATNFTVLSGLPDKPVRFDSGIPVSIPDATPAGIYSPIVVTNISSAVNKVVVSLQVNHTYDSDLMLQLISPDGTTNLLSASNGGAGQNYGINCSPDTLRTTFDDAAPTSISAGVPPWAGSYQPQQPLAVFIGKSGTNLNGTWLLHVVDQVAADTGTLDCWSLFITPALCTDGGGQCSGADLAVAMSATPNPVVASNLLTYNISVTNNGPSSVRNVSLTQILPASVSFVSATSSQGACSQAGGVLTCKLGGLDLRGTATIAVVVQPESAGTIVSTATVSSELIDPNLANNSAVVVTTVTPVSADLALSLLASPPNPLVGGPLNFTESVRNNGPSTATGVVVTNVLPASLSLASTTATQGHFVVFGNLVLWYLDSPLLNAGEATATIRTIPNLAGTITTTATVAGSQVDPQPNNNSASVISVLGPAADLGVGLAAVPNPVVLNGTLTYQVSVTNLGPSAADRVSLTGTLPNSVTVVSNFISQGSLSVNNNLLNGDLGTLASGATVRAIVSVTPTASGTINASVTVSAAPADTNSLNNSASVSTVVAPPFVAIAPAGVQLVGESFQPPDGAIEVGEIVTNRFYLADVGNVDSTNIVATLLATNGVLPLDPVTHAPLAGYSLTYGSLKASGWPVSNPYTFKALGTNGSSVAATFHVVDTLGGYSTNVSFVFALPTAVTFANTNTILVPDPAAPNPPYEPQSGPAKPYPSTLTVSGLDAHVARVTATLHGLTHSFLQDVNVLLVGPSGANSILMSHVGFPNGASSVNLTFDDFAPAALPASGAVGSGTWQPTAYNPPTFPANAPAGPYTAALSAFSGIDPNGTWSLYVYDDSGGDIGQILSGWSLTFTNVTPVNPLADLSLGLTAAPNPVNVGQNLTYTYALSNAGPAAATGILFSNPVPATAALVSATASAGSLDTSSGAVVLSLSSLAPGATATLTVVVAPSVTGTLSSTATVSSLEADLSPANNTVVSSVTVNPQPAEVALSLSAPSFVVVGSNLTYVVALTNGGPGAALGVVVTNPLPALVAYITNSSFQATTVLAGTNLVSSFGTIPAGVTVTNQVVVNALQLGTFTNLAAASLASSQTDLNPTNNSASIVVPVVLPYLSIAPAGGSVAAESFSPPDGIISPGETVTVQLGLLNNGTIRNTNLSATLLASGGVLAPSASQDYGLLLPGGPPVFRPFSFTASTTNGGVLLATLSLQDAGGFATNVTLALTVPNAFTNSGAVGIPQFGGGSPYPAIINVSGLTGIVTKASVTIYGLTHTFPSDVNVLLVSPSGSDALLMSHAGGAFSVTNGVTLTFDDAAPVALPNAALISSGAYRPTAYGSVAFPAPAPAGPYGSSLAAVNGVNPNGQWALYVLDDSPGDSGLIASGWSLNLATFEPLNSLADLALGLTCNPEVLFVGSPMTYTMSVTNLGPDLATNIVLTQTVPASYTVLSTNTSQGSLTLGGGLLTASLGSLGSGATATVTLKAAPSVSGAYTNTATVSGPVTDINQANNSASVSILVQPEGQFDGSFSGGDFHLTINAPGGTQYAIQTSTNLTDWTYLTTNIVPVNGVLSITDSNTPSFKQRFYRAVRLTP